MAGQGGSSGIVNSSFIGRTLWGTMFWLFIQLLMIMVLVPSSWLKTVIETEDVWLYEQLGVETAAYVETTGYSWYNKVLVETGLTHQMQSMFFMTQEERARSTGIQDLGQKTWFPWLEGRALALRFVFIQVFERLAHIWLWIPYALLLVIPAAWDGLMTWKMRQQSFEYSSPFWHRFSISTSITIFMTLIVGLFFPLPIPPVLLPIVILFVVPVLVIALISNMPKRI